MDGDPSSFSDAELQRIQYIWQRVAEDYAPFDVDVTTEDLGAEDLRNDGGDDTRWGIRCLITIDNFQGQGYGGYAYYNSFNWSSDTPAFVFENALQDNENYIAEAISHEVGHTLNLHHDGLDAAGVEYYKGHGSGDVGWAPIMGSGYYKNVTQFSKGEYNDPSNVEDDLAIITGSIPYRSDDHGDTPATATSLALLAGAFEGGGLIEQSSDLDVFSITVGTGAFAVSVAPYTRDPNLDLRLELLDAGGTVLAADNPASLLTASIDTTLSQGTYYLRLAGVGTGDPATGYSDYASIGQYRISGTATMPATGDPPSAVAAATPTSGSAPLSVAFSSAGSSDSDGTIVAYDWDFGDGGSSAEASPSHIYSSPGSYSATLTVLDDDGLAGISDAITITVAPPPAVLASTSELTVVEGDTATVDISLSADPGGPVVVTVAVTDGDSDITVSAGGTLEFTAANWSDPQTVTLAAALDADAIDGSATVVASADGHVSASFTVIESDLSPDLTSDLVLHHRLDESSGSTAADDSGNGLIGTLSGTPAWVPSDGVVDGALDFDGLDDLMTVANSDLINTATHGQRTVSLWFRAEDPSSTSQQLLYEEGGSARGLAIYLISGELRVFGWNDDSSESGWGGTLHNAAVAAGNWHHVVLVLDGGSTVSADAFRAWLDGSLIGSGAGSQLWSHSGGIGFGAINEGVLFDDGSSPSSGQFFAGLLDDARIYNRALDADEITALYALGQPPVHEMVASTTALDVPEGGSADFTLHLSAQPASTVTVSVARSAGDSDITVSAGSSLSFTTDNWSTPQTVTLAAAVDADNIAGSATIGLNADGYDAVTVTASEDESAMPWARSLRIGNGDVDQGFEISDPAGAPAGTIDGSATRFDDLDPDLDHSIVPMPGGGG